MADKVKYTKLRGSIYHLNIPIPPTIRAQYGGKVAFERSTGSSDPKEAERQVTDQRAEFNRQVREAQRRADQARLKSMLDPADAATIEALGGPGGLVKAIEGLREQAAFLIAGSGVTEPTIDIETTRWAGKGSDGAWNNSEVPFKVSTGGEDLPPDAMRDLQARAEANAQRAFMDSTTADLRHFKELAGTLDVPIPPAPSYLDEGDRGIRAIATKMADAKSYTKQLRDSLNYTVRRWIELHGDMPPAQWEKSHLNAFAEALKGLPITREKRIQNMPIRKAIEAAKAEGLETMGDKIRETRVDHMKTLAKYAMNQLGVLKANPFGSFTVIKAKEKHSARAASARQPFTPAEVGLVLAKCANYHPDTLDHWAPLIALYTGARREEIGQLLITDVKDWGNMLTITITDEGEDQKVKNKHSFRTIPVPPILLEQGFGAFVARRRQAGGKMLFLEEQTDNRTKTKSFREIALGKRGRFTENYGARFSRLVVEPLGLAGKGLAFHSTRHTWTDAARRAMINPEFRRLIAGRLDGEDLVESGYGGADLLQEKLDAMVTVTPFLTKD